MASLETMKGYYRDGLWTQKRLDTLMAAGKISQDDYDFITAEDSSEDDDTTNSEN